MEGMRLILFTGSRVLNILFYYPFKSKNYYIKYTEHGLFKCSNLVLVQSLNSSHFNLTESGEKEREDDERGGGWAIIRGRRLIEGRLLLEEIR